MVPEPYVAQRLRIEHQIIINDGVVGGELALLDPVEGKGGSGGGDIALDVRRLAFKFIWFDGEALDCSGQDRGPDDADQDQEHDRDHRCAQALVERPGEHANDHDDPGHHLHDLRRRTDVVVGVGRAEDESTRIESQFEARQPVAPDEQTHDDRDHQRQMKAYAQSRTRLSAVQQQPNAVDRGGNQHRQDRDAGGPALHELQRLEVEDVEAHVAPELRVFNPERLRVQKLQDQLPVTGRNRAEDDRQH